MTRNKRIYLRTTAQLAPTSMPHIAPSSFIVGTYVTGAPLFCASDDSSSFILSSQSSAIINFSAFLSLNALTACLKPV